MVQKQSELIKYDEGIINKLTEKLKVLHGLTITAKSNLSKLGTQITEIAKKANGLEVKLEGEEKKSIFSIIAQRIKNAFSKTPLLPPASKECQNIYQQSMGANDRI